MSFLGQSPPDREQTVDEPGVMHIGGPRGRRLREIARWIVVIFIVAAVMVMLFMRFGATTLWAFGLVFFMLSYMALMGRWAGEITARHIRIVLLNRVIAQYHRPPRNATI